VTFLGESCRQLWWDGHPRITVQGRLARHFQTGGTPVPPGPLERFVPQISHCTSARQHPVPVLQVSPCAARQRLTRRTSAGYIPGKDSCALSHKLE